MDDEFKTLEKYIGESKNKFASRRRLRELNLHDNIEYPNEELLSKLDSSIKKNSAFVKRLKVFTESQKEQILNEIDRINSTKFISEVASSIIEAKLKLSDIPSVIEICTKLNRIYKEFSKNLLEQYIKYFPIIKRKNFDSNSPFQLSSSSSLVAVSSTSNSGGLISSGSSSNLYQSSNLVSKGQSKSSNELNQTFNLSKIRVDLRLFAELIICGIFPLKDSFPILMNLLCYLMLYEKSSYQNANAILTFCKACGDELLGAAPKNILILAKTYNKELPTSDLIPIKRQELLKTYMRDYYQSITKHLHQLQEDLNELVNKNKKIYKAKGEISKESKELVEIKHSDYRRFYHILSQLADLLGEKNLDLPEDFELLKEQQKNLNPNSDICEPLLDTNQNSNIWDDEGTRGFYEDLLDLKALFPNLVIKVSSAHKKQALTSNEFQLTKEESKKVEDIENSQIIKLNKQEQELKVNCELEQKSPTTTTATSIKVNQQEEKDLGEDDASTISTTSSSTDEEEGEGEEEVDNTTLEEDGEQSSQLGTSLVMIQAVANRTQPDQYFSKLSCCVNRDMIDNAAIDFIRFFNTKFGRRKLIKTLFNVQRTRLDLLPFYARLTATIYPYVPSVGNELVSLLRQDFRNLFRKKDQINIESKVKNVRFIGELVKFNLYSKQEGLNCLKMLLSDFTHHHIEMTCNLLETCGRLLYKSNDSHHQLRLLLEQMMRKKLLLSVDSKYVTMIENAYYFTNPPEIVSHVVEEPSVHMYVRYLLYECLNRSSIDTVLKKVKKLNWNDKTLSKFAINCMIEAYNIKFYNIRYLAALLAALNKVHPWISVLVIDGVVEDILLMMEINEVQFNQRRIPMIRYFGELYNYRLSDSSLVFKILYSLITYGVYYPEPEQTLTQIPMSNLDQPDNLFRIKLVCDLLETCGQYLSSGQEKKKLDCYLLFFQRYYWCKKNIYMLHPYCLAKSSNQFPASIEYLYNDAIFNLRPTFRMATSYTQAIQAVKNFIDNLIVNQSTT